MNTDTIDAAISAARGCAMQMMLNAGYILKELPTLGLGEVLRAKVQVLCERLIGTKHDVMSELSEIGSPDGAARDAEHTIKRIVSMVGSDISDMDSVVNSLQEAMTGDANAGLAFMLVAESAVNILNAFNELADAARLDS